MAIQWPLREPVKLLRFRKSGLTQWAIHCQTRRDRDSNEQISDNTGNRALHGKPTGSPRSRGRGTLHLSAYHQVQAAYRWSCQSDSPASALGSRANTHKCLLLRSSVQALAESSCGATDATIRECLIDDINESLISLATLKGWDTAPIHKLHAEIVKREYQFSGTSGRPLKNPSNTLTASAAWNTDQYINIGVLVQRSKDTPHEFFTATRIGISLGLFESLLGPVEWVNEKTVRLYQTNKRDYWEIDTSSREVIFHYPRAESNDAHGQFDLAKMYIDGWIVEQDFEQARLWLERAAAQGFSRAVKLLQRMINGDENLADPVMNSKK